MSTIDHFAASQAVLLGVSEAGVLHEGENPSNHSAIYTKLNVGKFSTEVERIESEKRTNWRNATSNALNHFYETLGDRLRSIEAPECLSCQDVLCTKHGDSIEKYTVDILESIETAAKDSLPSTGGIQRRGKSIIPGWSEYVKPYCSESKFWRSIWISSGKPNCGYIFQAMNQSKNQYKYAVRRLKRANDKIQNDKFCKSILRGGVNMFDEIRKYRGKSRTCSSRIDEEVGSGNIAGHFANIYQQLYNRTEHGELLENVHEHILQGVGQGGLVQAERITEEVIAKALKKMKPGKNYALYDFQSDCLIHGPPELVHHLTHLIRSFVIHGQIPSIIMLCTLLPIVKDNLGDITSSSNYRAIATGSLLLKLLDIVILMLEGDKLACDPMQFGFQSKSSTAMCTWAVTATIDHFISNGRNVFGCAMDLSKAFDMVEWGELFSALVGKGIHPIFLRVLLFIYKNQKCNVKWAGQLSEKFDVSNGVRQGAISSPLLFSVYIDELLRILRKSGLGCHISQVFLACYGYADDLMLLSASKSGLQEMINICEKFAKKKNLKFSTDPNPSKSKTKGVIFSKKAVNTRNIPPVLLNGDPLPWVSQVKHLGHVLQCNNSMQTDCLQKRGKLIGKLNSFSQEFHFVQPEVFVKILCIYATSFYGSNLWNLYSKDCERIFSAWNVSIRQCFGLARETHRYFIEDISEVLHPKTVMCGRLAGFHRTLKTSLKFPIRFLVNLKERDQRSYFGENLCKIGKECGKPFPTKEEVKKHLKFFRVPENEKWRIPLIKDLIACKYGMGDIPNLSLAEIEEILGSICTT